MPMPPCSGACPDWLDDGFATRLTVLSAQQMHVAVVDGAHRFQDSELAAEGTLIGRDISHTLTFEPDASASYTAPDAREPSVRGRQRAERWRSFERVPPQSI